MPTPAKILLVMRGGCLIAAYAPQPGTKIEIIDCDDLTQTTSSETMADLVDESATGLARIY